MNVIIALRGISFELPNGRELFKNLSFSLGVNLTALVGCNGVGKSCLAQILAGKLKPTTGEVVRNGPITYLPQIQAPGPISVDEYLAYDYEWSPHKEALLDGINRQALCTDLSGGEWMRVRLAQALDGHFLVLDEPTNDLDRRSRKVVLDYLRAHTRGALVISHDRECLGLCQNVLELSNRGLARYGGGWQGYSEWKSREVAALNKALDSAKRERDTSVISRNEQRLCQEKRNRRGAELAKRGGMPKMLLGIFKENSEVTSGKLNTASIGRLEGAVQNVRNALEELKVEPVMFADLLCSPIPAQKLVAQATGFNVRFNEWVYVADLNFSWRGNARIALKGSNGSGKSTLLRAVLGSGFHIRGQLRRGDLATLYIDQRCSSLDEKLSVLENVHAQCDKGEVEIRNGLAKFLFAGETVFEKVQNLSGGERLRAALACGLLGSAKPELLVLDEPTNNLDLANIEFLERVVSEFRGALIVVSHDEVFLKNCGIDQEFDLDRGGVGS